MASTWTVPESFPFGSAVVRYACFGQGPALVLLHNGGTSSTIWRHLAHGLAADHQVFAMDLPGFGASSSPEGGLCLASLVDLLSAFLRERVLGPAHLVGNCMGSAMAMKLAGQQPSLVRRMVLFNPLTERTFRRGLLAPFLWVDERSRFPLDKLDALARGLTLPAPLARTALYSHFGSVGLERGLVDDRDLLACYKRLNQLTALRHLLGQMKSFGPLDGFRPGPGFPPICTVWGEQNRILSAREGRLLNDTWKPQHAEWLPRCGHLAMLEEPEQCETIVRSFLSSKVPTNSLSTGSGSSGAHAPG
jgi:pimeloyl-ACP methyl ester carboxylesterase